MGPRPGAGSPVRIRRHRGSARGRPATRAGGKRVSYTHRAQHTSLTPNFKRPHHPRRDAMTTKSSNHIRPLLGRAAVLAACLLSVSFGVAHAATTTDDVPTVVVAYSDLDLGTEN